MEPNKYEVAEKQLREFDLTIPTRDGKSVAERIRLLVPMEFDAELGEWLIGAEGRELIENTKARLMGLMLPHEIRSLREKLNLTQDALASLLKIGEKSWTRWESGRQRPSQSTNLMLRLLQTGAISIDVLRQVQDEQSNFKPELLVRPTVPETLRMSFGPVVYTPKPGYADCAEYEGQPLAA